MSNETANFREVGSATGGTWSRSLRVVVSIALAVHIVAILAGSLAVPPASGLEREVAQGFSPYYQAIDQGYAYRYYAPEPPPTPVAIATLSYADGRPDETVRLPDRGMWPRMRYQRHLALANALIGELEAVRAAGGDPAQARWARSFARHLGKTHPGCKSVSLAVQLHLIPPQDRVRELLRSGERVDLDAPEFYTVPERIGEFPCDAS
ncbi:hypothetical protein EP7_000310 [Isosphaeraceae bacterium EP7]